MSMRYILDGLLTLVQLIVLFVIYAVVGFEEAVLLAMALMLTELFKMNLEKK